MDGHSLLCPGGGDGWAVEAGNFGMSSGLKGKERSQASLVWGNLRSFLQLLRSTNQELFHQAENMAWAKKQG